MDIPPPEQWDLSHANKGDFDVFGPNFPLHSRFWRGDQPPEGFIKEPQTYPKSVSGETSHSYPNSVSGETSHSNYQDSNKLQTEVPPSYKSEPQRNDYYRATQPQVLNAPKPKPRPPPMSLPRQTTINEELKNPYGNASAPGSEYIEGNYYGIPVASAPGSEYIEGNYYGIPVASAPPVDDVSHNFNQALYPPIDTMYPPKRPINSICQKYDISEEQLLDTKDRKQIVFIDDSYSNITEAFIHEDRSGQIIDACRMIVELNSVHNTTPVSFKLINQFWSDSDVIYTPKEYDIWCKVIEWDGGTKAGIRLNAILEEYFIKWNENPNVKPVNIIYIGDGAIEDLELYTACIVNAAKVSAARGKPRNITFQMFQVGEDQSAKSSFEYMDNELKNKYGMKCDIVDCVYGNGNLTQKIIKGMVGASVEYVDNQPNY